MNTLRAIPLALSCLLTVFAPAVCADDADQATLHVADRGGSYELSVPPSMLVMNIPKGDFLPQEPSGGGAAQSPRYFAFSDQRQHIMVSGWFEPSFRYSGFDQVWKDEKAAWRSAGLPVPENEARYKVGGWEAVAYDVGLPEGARKAGVGDSHIRAFWIQAGTWVDVHVSMTSSGTAAERREKLMALLKSMEIRQRP